MLNLAQMRETIPLVQLCDSAIRKVSWLDKGVQSPSKILLKLVDMSNEQWFATSWLATADEAFSEAFSHGQLACD